MKTYREILESKQNLKADVNQFMEEDDFYKHYKSSEDFRGTCDGVSSDLYKFLLAKGHDNIKLIEGVGVKFDLPADHPNINIPHYVSHVVLQAGNKVVDLTGMQFEFEKVRIIPLSQFKKQWVKIKPFKAWGM